MNPWKMVDFIEMRCVQAAVVLLFMCANVRFIFKAAIVVQCSSARARHKYKYKYTRIMRSTKF